jgi:hypothetical protein
MMSKPRIISGRGELTAKSKKSKKFFFFNWELGGVSARLVVSTLDAHYSFQ